MAKKSTMVELVDELTKRNKEGLYDEIITEAKAGEYHDFKNTKYDCGKKVLFGKLCDFPELHDIAESVIRGEYDEEMDEDDKKKMAADLRENGAGENLLELLGLKGY